MIDNKLRTINFAAGIFSTPLNENFTTIYHWIRRERLRLGGYGIADGFEMSYDGNYSVQISAGVLIDRNGDEIITDDVSIYCGKPVAEKASETVTVGSGGVIKLKFVPYSPTRVGWITYSSLDGDSVPNSAEFSISTQSGTRTIAPLIINGKEITVADRWAGQNLVVNYYYSNDRIDAFLLDENGNITRQAGIESESPSSADVDADLETSFLIGFAHWIIGSSVDVEFIIDDRTYRKVYVDSQNRLYLNGKLYDSNAGVGRKKSLLPEDGELWYNKEENILYAWSESLQQWRVVNDFSSTPHREAKIWTPEENPEDLQTFLFGDDELNLRFIPGQHSLEIVIDHAVLMEDQYEEVIVDEGKEFEEYGAGFKLAYPLDKAAYVQCIVHQVGSNEATKSVFQKASIFTYEGSITYSENNTDRLFTTDLPFAAGENQLEVFVDGRRLTTGHFQEMVNPTTPVEKSHTGQNISMFTILDELQEGQEVIYKISRYVWSYSQLNSLMEKVRQDAQTAMDTASNLTQRFDVLTRNVTEKIDALTNIVSTQATEIAKMTNYRKKTEKIAFSDFADEVLQRFYRNTSVVTFNAADIANSIIPDCDENDVLFVNYVDSLGGRQLIENKEYTVEFKKGNAEIHLSQPFISTGITIYVFVIRFGKEAAENA